MQGLLGHHLPMRSAHEDREFDFGAAMNDRPLVSIAMCTYNGERFLREQLDSLVQQDYRPLEIQIYDDRSTDGTFAILKEYEAEYDFIHAHKNETNLGFIRNFETAIGACSGDFIALCDQDDVWFPEKISILVQEIGEHMLIYSKSSLIDEQNQPRDGFLSSINRLSGSCYRSLILGNCVTGHTCLIRRNLLQHALPFPKDIDYHDHWLAFVAAAAGTIKNFDRPLSFYRYHAKNVSFDLNRKKTKKRNPSLRRFFGRRKKIKRALLKTARNLSALQELSILKPEDRALIGTLADEVQKSVWLRSNKRLQQLLESEPELLNLYKDKAHFIHRFSKGSFLRF
jgi:glycosyltransferase involved in cell wall biosynthesis